MCWWIPVTETSGKSSPWKNSLGPYVVSASGSADQAGRQVARSRWGRQRKAKRLELRARLQNADWPESLCRTAHFTVEPAIGIIKVASSGFVRFRLRGLH